MKNKKIFYIILTIVIVITGVALCINLLKTEEDLFGSSTLNEVKKNNSLVLDDNDYKVSYENETIINLNNLTINGEGASISENIITLTDGKDYYITGENDAQIIIDSEKNVHLILDNINMSYNSGSPIYVKNAEKVIITLKENSINNISDSDNYIIDAEGEPDATLFSKDDLVINGNGTLNVNANYKDGIASKDGLKIVNANIKIVSIDDGIRGKDYIYIEESNINIESNGDGIKSTNDIDSSLGFITIESGTFYIQSETDGIDSIGNLYIKNGKFNIISGGGSVNSSTTYDSWGKWGIISSQTDISSAKGLKSDSNIVIEDGEFNIDSSDDSFHCNLGIVINNGTINILSGDDGIHADSNLVINNGLIKISKSYEGIEGSNVTINGGDISIIASDDGINSSGGTDTMSNERPGRGNFNKVSDTHIYITEGTVYVNASGDGIDSNGSIYLSGGTLIINGPVDNGNGAIDKEGSFKITGGTLIASGSSGMALMPDDEDSTINSVMINFDTTIESGNIISINDSLGNEIITYESEKNYNNLVVSSSKLEKGNYVIYINGNTSLKNIYGLYEVGDYSGEEYNTFAISSLFTKVGNNMGMLGNSGMMPSDRPQNGRR